MNFIDNLIRSSLEAALNSVNKNVTNMVGDLSKTPMEFNATIWGRVEDIAKVTVLPIAYTLLGLFFLIELWNITVKYNSSNDILPTEPFKLLFKVAMGKMIMEKTFEILLAFFGVATAITTGISIPSAGMSTADVDALMLTLDGMGNLEKVFVWFETLPIGFVLFLMGLMVKILILGRMVEIFLYTAISPIPMATLINAEVSSIGKGFLKTYGAVVLQGVFMVIIVGIYATLVETAATSDNIKGAMGEVLVYSGVLLLALWNSSKWAKAVLQ